jgi:prolyl 4-hydroxylase
MIIKRLAAAAVVAAISCAILPSASFARDVDEAAAASASSAGDANKQAVPPSDKLPYGVDVSWPTHSHALLDPPGGPRGGHADRLQAYQEFMDGCYERYGPIQCERTEYDRVAMNVEQPPTVANYTHAGYAKLPVPAGARRLLGEVWRRNDSARPEYWDEGNSYTNHWKSPTSYLALDRFLTIQQRRTVLHQVQEVLEQWTQTRLVPTSLYGLRVYRRGAVLAPHVDRFPLVISAILNVAQNIDGEDDESGHREDWPLEVIGHDGVAVNVTMKPGEMILYESASVVRSFVLARCPGRGDILINRSHLPKHNFTKLI